MPISSEREAKGRPFGVSRTVLDKGLVVAGLGPAYCCRNTLPANQIIRIALDGNIGENDYMLYSFGSYHDWRCLMPEESTLAAGHGQTEFAGGR